MFPFGSLFAENASIDLQAVDCEESRDGFNATCEIRVYKDYSGRQGECWFDDQPITEDRSVWTFKNLLIDPATSILNYQMKWDALSGDPPTWDLSAAEGVWQALSDGDFHIAWHDSTSGSGSDQGSVTVSIRKGTGLVLDTAIWTGDANRNDE